MKPPTPYTLEITEGEKRLLDSALNSWVWDGTPEQKDNATKVRDKLRELTRQEQFCQLTDCYKEAEFVLQHRDRYVSCSHHVGDLVRELTLLDASFGPILVTTYDPRMPL